MRKGHELTFRGVILHKSEQRRDKTVLQTIGFSMGNANYNAGKLRGHALSTLLQLRSRKRGKQEVNVSASLFIMLGNFVQMQGIIP